VWNSWNAVKTPRTFVYKDEKRRQTAQRGFKMPIVFFIFPRVFRGALPAIRQESLLNTGRSTRPLLEPPVSSLFASGFWPVVLPQNPESSRILVLYLLFTVALVLCTLIAHLFIPHHRETK
jgi:hypothetical protein